MGPETPRPKPEDLGGEDKKEEEEQEQPYYNKSDHFNRSVFHSPQHIKHEKEVEKK